MGEQRRQVRAGTEPARSFLNAGREMAIRVSESHIDRHVGGLNCLLAFIDIPTHRAPQSPHRDQCSNYKSQIYYAFALGKFLSSSVGNISTTSF